MKRCMAEVWERAAELPRPLWECTSRGPHVLGCVEPTMFGFSKSSGRPVSCRFVPEVFA
jgi:hypothetical protein